ncbi:MAG: nitrate reductase subunit beta, partial [Solirubrobacterales bacterium]
EDRYVIPQAHTELADRMMEKVGACGLDFEGGPGNCGAITDPAADLLNAAADQEPFMLTQEPVELDIVKMAGERRDSEDPAAS